MPEHRRHHTRSRSRSHSPSHHDRRPSHRSYRSRSGEPSRRDTKKPSAPTKPLPHGARELSRHDLPAYRPLFALYLDIQKQLNLEELDDAEVKGRWKSFLGKWNRGELALGWYDPQTLEKARAQDRVSPSPPQRTSTRPDQTRASDSRPPPQGDEDTDEEMDFGPTLPSSLVTRAEQDESLTSRSQGASIPSLDDLRARDDQAIEEAHAARREHMEQLRYERHLDRKSQKERLDELAPRAEPGSRERQLEKKRERAEANRSFAASKEATGDVELMESELMGDEDGIGDLKRLQKEQERKKNERELRREEILRARRAEREIKLQAVKEKEEKTMSVFKEIARQRFGSGDAS